MIFTASVGWLILFWFFFWPFYLVYLVFIKLPFIIGRAIWRANHQPKQPVSLGTITIHHEQR